MKQYILYLFFLISCTSSNLSQTQTTVDNKYNSVVYEREIKTLRVYPNVNNEFQEIFPAVAEIGKTNLILEFDDLVEGTENYYAKLIHCNSDWEKSRLSPLQYVSDYNEFPINDFEFSAGTKIPYVHYKFQIPQVKIPGNYILEVYRDSEEQTVFRKRIMFFQPMVKIISDDLNQTFLPNMLNQRINFLIDYSNYDLINPLERVIVVIRQNQRWDNSLMNLRPTYVRPDQHELEYQYFDDENIFSGGNEFRAFDIRSINSAGANVQQMVRRDSIYAHLMSDIPRDYQAYGTDKDLNGNYVIMNYDLGNDDYQSDYVNVIFTLKTGRKFLGDIYIHGGLSNWATMEENRMEYKRNIKGYQKKLLLKQGWYNYQYLLKNDSLKSDYLEGQHWETENSYEILVYYRSLNLDADILIGYSQWYVNPQF